MYCNYNYRNLNYKLNYMHMCSVAPDPVNSINFCPKIKTFFTV